VAWDKACKDAGHYSKDERTHRNQLNIHRLRGFFKTQVMPIVGSEISELMIGHSDPYGNAYNGLPDSKLETEYQRCESALTIAAPYGVARQMKKQEEETEMLKYQVQELKAVIKKMMIKDGFPEVAQSGTEIAFYSDDHTSPKKIIL
jgi:hypothetical protein